MGSAEIDDSEDEVYDSEASAAIENADTDEKLADSEEVVE